LWAGGVGVSTHACGLVGAASRLTQLSFGCVGGVVGEQTADEEETGVTRKHAGKRTVVEVGVGLDSLVPAVRRPLGQNIEGEVFVGWHGVVQLLEAGHVHGPGVAGEVQVVAGRGGVCLEPVVRVLDALRRAEDALHVVQRVPDFGCVAADGEGGGQGDGVAAPYDAHDGQQEREVQAHVEDVVNGRDGVD